MKSVFPIVFLLLSTLLAYAQVANTQDTADIDNIDKGKIKLYSDTAGNEPVESVLIDSTLHNIYGDLLDDDPEYNKKYPIWIPAIEVFSVTALTWSFDRYVLNADYARIGLKTWKYNLQKGFEWDQDGFGINFIGHPYSGALSFNAARSNGYNYLQSFSFAVAGSLMWEYFGENTRPSYSDIIVTPVNGAFLGEILYRLSSNILDDRTRGGDRLFREIAAGVVNPMRGINRLMQGKSFRITNKEVYEKEPLNISLYSGLNRIIDEKSGSVGEGTNSIMVNAGFDYGDPFEIRSRKPFDFFRFQLELDFGVGRKFLDNITGYGILFGKNSQIGKMPVLSGLFQYFDYWDNNTFELSAVGFGGGVISRLPVSNKVNLCTNVHLALMPLAGNNTHFGPDTSQVRNYNFGGGFEGKFESTINFGQSADISLIYYNYMIHTYDGVPGNNFIHILKPRITIRLYKDLRIGFENYIYVSDRYLRNLPSIHSTTTEQKIFLMLSLVDHRRKGHFN